MDEFDRRACQINAAAQRPWEKVNISKGMAVFQPGFDGTVEQVLHRADELMYQKKRESKGNGPSDN